MLVTAKGEVALNTLLSELLHVTASTAAELGRRFEVSRFDGGGLREDELPWQRAARGETFAEVQIWYDRERAERVHLFVRGQTWDGQGVVAFEDLSEHPFALQRATLAGSIAAALLRSSDDVQADHAVVEDVGQALGAAAVFLLSASAHERRLRLVASLGLPPDQVLEHQSVSLDVPSVLALAARTQTLQMVDDLDHAPDRDYPGARRLRELGLRSMAALPLLAEGELLGVLGLAWRHRGKLNKLEQRTLRGVAAACALSLRRARFRVIERREAQQLRTLRDAAMAIEGALPLRDLLSRLVEQARELTQARYGALGVLNPEGTALSDFVFAGVSEEVGREIGRLPEGKGLLGAVIRERRTIRSADLRQDPAVSGFPFHHPPMTSFLGTPLRVGGEVFGNFYLCDKDGGGGFDDEDEKMLELFAAQSALVVGYARQQQLTKEAERQRERLRDDFAATIAHDIRSPISSILLQIDGLLHVAGGGEQVPVPIEALERIRRNGRRVARIANDLLDVARMATGRLTLDRAPVAPRSAVESAISELGPLLARHPVETVVEDGVPEILADRGRVEQVLTNLLENATKYSGPGAPVRVLIRREGEGARITVEDQGPGIAPEVLSRLFERFYQAPSAGERPGGLGLGLYIARALVEAHGGRLWVESALGSGSRFHLWMPRGDTAELSIFQ